MYITSFCPSSRLARRRAWIDQSCTLTADCCFCSPWYVCTAPADHCMHPVQAYHIMCSVQLFALSRQTAAAVDAVFHFCQLQRRSCAKLSREINDQPRGIDGQPAVTQTALTADRFLPRCMECRRGLAMRILSVRPSVRPLVKRVDCHKKK